MPIAAITPRVPTLFPTHQSMMLVDKAAENPRMLKLISVAVHSARPPMTGTRERLTSSPGEDNTHKGHGWQPAAGADAPAGPLPGASTLIRKQVGTESSPWRNTADHRAQLPHARRPLPNLAPHEPLLAEARLLGPGGRTREPRAPRHLPARHCGGANSRSRVMRMDEWSPDQCVKKGSRGWGAVSCPGARVPHDLPSILYVEVTSLCYILQSRKQT